MLIAHDLGTTGDKASLHEDDGRLLSSVTISYPARFGHDGLAEQDPRAWTDAVAAATARLLESTGTDPSAVAGLVISGQMMGRSATGRRLRAGASGDHLGGHPRRRADPPAGRPPRGTGGPMSCWGTA